MPWPILPPVGVLARLLRPQPEQPSVRVQQPDLFPRPQHSFNSLQSTLANYNPTEQARLKSVFYSPMDVREKSGSLLSALLTTPQERDWREAQFETLQADMRHQPPITTAPGEDWHYNPANDLIVRPSAEQASAHPSVLAHELTHAYTNFPENYDLSQPSDLLAVEIPAVVDQTLSQLLAYPAPVPSWAGYLDDQPIDPQGYNPPLTFMQQAARKHDYQPGRAELLQRYNTDPITKQWVDLMLRSASTAFVPSGTRH